MPELSREGRSGRYVKQLQGYKAFIPATLPPDPEIEYSEQLNESLSKAGIALGRLDGSIQILPNSDRFIDMYVRKEAVISSQIEGTQSSLSNLLKREAEFNDPDAPGDVTEVSNYVRAMRKGLSLLDTLPVSGRLVREIHEELLKNVRGQEKQPGEFRKSQNWIGAEGCSLRTATFVPPPPEQMLQAMSDWEHFLHADDHVPDLVKIGLAHAQFETIHPFLDGNGRVGRLLITLLLCERGILQKPVLYLSYYFKQHRQEYYDLLQGTRDKGDWESWLRFFIDGVNEVCEQATDTAKSIVELRERDRMKVIDSFGQVAANGLKVLETLFANPYMTINKIRSILDISFPSASALMTRFEDAGILVEVTGQSRNRQFEYSDYLNLFSSL